MKIFQFIFIAFLVSGFVLNDARKANEAYERGDFEEAVQLYRSAIQQVPDNPKLYFNLGNALAQMGDQDEAARAYEQYRSMTENPGEKSMADYNQGRMLTDSENYEEALNYFREALKKNPDDVDARYNYELAKRRQQQQDQNQDQQQQQDQDQDQDNEDQNQQQQNQDQDQQQNEQQQNNQQQNPDSEQQQNQEQQPRPQELTKEEAENLLDALEQLERELLENQKKESSQSNTRNEKDW
jgi:Ca-activated chloride channel homolog